MYFFAAAQKILIKWVQADPVVHESLEPLPIAIGIIAQLPKIADCLEQIPHCVLDRFGLERCKRAERMFCTWLVHRLQALSRAKLKPWDRHYL
jgi:hypothetical protein